MPFDTPPLSPEILAAHRSFLREVARELLHHADDADEVAGEAIAAAIGSKTFREGDVRAPRAWLASITRNFARLRIRKESSRRRLESLAARKETISSAEALVHEEAARRMVVDAVISLPEPFRSAIVARFYDDLPPRMIAARMGVSAEVAAYRLRKGLALLRTRLDAAGGGRDAWSAALLVVARADDGGVRRKLVIAGAAAAIVSIAAFAMFARPEPNRSAALAKTGTAPRTAPATAAEAPASGSARVEVVPAAASQTAVKPSNCIIGSVADERRRPIAGAEVRLRPSAMIEFAEGENPTPRVETATDADGMFLLKTGAASATAAFVEVRASGFAPAAVVDIQADRERYDVGMIILQRPRAVIVRTLDAAGIPIAGARVACRWNRNGGRESEIIAATGDDGRARIDGLPAVVLGCSASASGFAAEPVEFTPLEDGAEQIIQLEKETLRQCRVEDAAGTPVTGAQVAAVRASDGAPLASAVTDAGGACTLAGLTAASAARVTVRAFGFEPKRINASEIPAAAKIILTAAPLVEVSARETASGRAVEIAALAYEFRRDPQARSFASIAAPVRAADVHTARVLAPERWLVRGLAQRARFVVTAADGRRAATQEFDPPQAGGGPLQVSAAFEASDAFVSSPEITGVVVDAAGSPLAGAEVGATVFSTMIEKRTVSTAAGARGEFTLRGVPPWDGSVTATAPGRKRASAVLRAGRTAPLELRLVAHAPPAVRGTVTVRGKPPGRPVRVLMFQNLDQSRTGVSTHLMLAAYSDAAGGFEFPDVEPGRYEFAVQSVRPVPEPAIRSAAPSRGIDVDSAAPRVRADVREGEDAVVAIDHRPASVSGIVTFNGAPRAAVALRLEGADRMFQITSATGADGRYRFDLDGSGAYVLTPLVAGTARKRELLLPPGADAAADLSFETGRVEGSAGGAAAFVELRDAAFEPVGAMPASPAPARIHDGAYRFDDAVAGTVRAAAFDASGRCVGVSPPFRIEAGATVRAPEIAAAK